MTPPLRKWGTAEEKTDAGTLAPDEEKPDLPVIPTAGEISPHETPESLPEERESDMKTNAETAGGPRLDMESAASVEAEEEQNAAAAEAPVAASEASLADTDSAALLDANADAELPAKPPAPKKTRRRKTSAETAANAIPDMARENYVTPDEKPAGPKTRTSAVRKPRKKTAVSPEDTDVTPKEEA
jgi:hypothetical protein